MLFWEIFAFEKVKKRISDAPLVVVLDVDYCILFEKKLWEKLPTASFKRRVLYHFQGEFDDSGESQPGFVPNEFRVELPDLICEDPKGVDIRICESGDCSIASEDASRCSA